ncbi:sigma-70 family RNA polymerase sigma factor [Thalassomonas actiniarum]|uniref:Sigma-70 family RNA polymerase sigma factor n=1 Tax=Thalassomonas actiniarum TaxID=485447 RepID=A0AAE9YW64_9GAMM|nr:sigma-70 family RNA polymerase sigma factor [Thalassomonas actiniarum]WDE01612.1 sigma-70 family RNA polymerase sigma factor [Thalassomonas actiniarum]
MDPQEYFSLLSATSQGDKKAFSALYQATAGKLFALCLKILGNKAAAEEALQDAFVKIWHNAGEYQAAKGAVMTWMTSIVRYRCLDMLRQKNVRKELALDEEGVSNKLGSQHGVHNFEDEFCYEENSKLADCMQALEQQQKQAIHLAYFKGLSHHEVVQYIHSPLGTVKSWIRRGLLQLQRCLSL